MREQLWWEVEHLDSHDEWRCEFMLCIPCTIHANSSDENTRIGARRCLKLTATTQILSAFPASRYMGRGLQVANWIGDSEFVKRGGA